MDLTTSYEDVFPGEVLDRYAFRETRNAASILAATDRRSLDEVVDVLSWFELGTDDVLASGGNKSDVARRLDEAFRQRGWREGRVDTRTSLEVRRMPYREAGEREAVVVPTEVLNEGYKVDNLKDRVVLDVEWIAKDGNLDRDLAAYRSLYDAGLIDVGVIVTCTRSGLRDLAVRLEPNTTKFKTTTATSLEKLEPRLTRGDGGGCPILAIAISERCYEAR